MASAASSTRPLAGRPFWVVAHRWAGLTLALFLGIAGLTGTLMPWMEELEVATAPEMHLSSSQGPHDPLRIRDDVLARYPGAAVDFLPLSIETGHALRLHLHWLDPRTGLEREHGPGVPEWDDLFLDPVTGKELGRRQWGNIGQGVKNLMPFVCRVHYTLAAGTVGLLTMGVAAVVWTLDCFVGFYLTLPPRVPGAPFWRRWRPSWQVRGGKNAYKLAFDLHRAGGLWLWPLLLVFAWSSVSFNLPQVHAPVMTLFGATDPRAVLADNALPEPRHAPALDFRAATERGQALAQQLVKERGLTIRADGERWIWHVPTSGLYIYGFTTSADIGHHGGGTRIAFDSSSGAVRAIELPSGENGANTFSNWLSALHMAQVFGLPYRVLVSILGLGVAMLSVTGVVIWTRKRSARAGRRLKIAAASLRPAKDAGL